MPDSHRLSDSPRGAPCCLVRRERYMDQQARTCGWPVGGSNRASRPLTALITQPRGHSAAERDHIALPSRGGRHPGNTSGSRFARLHCRGTVTVVFVIGTLVFSEGDSAAIMSGVRHRRDDAVVATSGCLEPARPAGSAAASIAGLLGARPSRNSRVISARDTVTHVPVRARASICPRTSSPTGQAAVATSTRRRRPLSPSARPARRSASAPLTAWSTALVSAS